MYSGLLVSSLRIKIDGQLLLEIDELWVEKAKVVCIMGSSGCGKSTLLSALCGTLDSAFSFEGTVLLDGVDITFLRPEKRRTGILFQDDLLFPHLSVAENLSFAIPRAVKSEARKKKVAEALSLFDLEGLGFSDPAHLSGGQRSRVSLARALLGEPRALFLDEPFSNLDAPLRRLMQQQTLDHIKKAELPSIMVTHDQDVAQAMGGQIFEMKNKTLIAKAKNLR